MAKDISETKIWQKIIKGLIKKDKKISIRVASLKDISAMKRASGRPIDLSDLQLIKELKK
jgi:predicted DNA binding CopG/RHH family protein